MTKEEAYNAMQEGLCVSHKDFNEGEFLYMDETYIIKDEKGYDYEASWDALEKSNRWDTGWYIFKGNKSKTLSIKGKLSKKAAKEIADSSQFISHNLGKPCPGKNRCLQFMKIAGETACLVCDANGVFIEEDKVIYNLEDKELSIEDLNETVVNKSLAKRIINKIVGLFK